MADENCVDAEVKADDFDNSLNNGKIQNKTKEPGSTDEDAKNEYESKDLDDDGNM